MRKALRSFELIYRLGGEEFLVVLPGANLDDGTEVAERLRKTVEAALSGGLELTVSFGVSAGAGQDVVYERLYKAADEALYDAKAAGRNCVVRAGGSAPAAPAAEPVLTPAG
jgi:diguanylate cyclase (GGDEF)-like protein